MTHAEKTRNDRIERAEEELRDANYAVTDCRRWIANAKVINDSIGARDGERALAEAEEILAEVQDYRSRLVPFGGADLGETTDERMLTDAQTRVGEPQRA